MAYRFRLLRGVYVGTDGTKYKAKSPGKDRIESEERLDERFGSDKFQLLAGSSEPVDTPTPEESEPPPDLESMTIAELREFAASEQIDLGTATKKDEIINTIREALESR